MIFSLVGWLSCLSLMPLAVQMRVEGYLPENGEPSTAPLYLYWNQNQGSDKDNLVTTDPQVRLCPAPAYPMLPSHAVADVSLPLDTSAAGTTTGSCLRCS